MSPAYYTFKTSAVFQVDFSAPKLFNWFIQLSCLIIFVCSHTKEGGRGVSGLRRDELKQGPKRHKPWLMQTIKDCQGSCRLLRQFQSLSQSVSQSISKFISQSVLKVMIMSWESHEKVMKKSWKIHEKVMRNSLKKSLESHEKIIRKSLESHERVMSEPLKIYLKKKSLEIHEKGIRNL